MHHSSPFKRRDMATLSSAGFLTNKCIHTIIPLPCLLLVSLPANMNAPLFSFVTTQSFTSFLTSNMNTPLFSFTISCLHPYQ